MDDLRRRHQPVSPPPLAATPWVCLWEPPPQEASGITVEELKQALLRTTLELESTRIAAQEELRRMESQALHLTHLLEVATRERDEAHALLLLLMGQNHHLASNSINPAGRLDAGSNMAAAGGLSSEEEAEEGGGVEEEEERSNGTPPAHMAAVEAAALQRGLPEKGRLLEAVMGAGPLLQTLLLAGPLPQWRHPPPALQTFEIPPVSIGLLNAGNDTTAKRERDEVDTTTTMGFGGGVRSLSLPNSSSPPPETECKSGGVSKYRRITSFHL